jgi:hypothetical protein
MQLFFILLISTLISCSGSTTGDKNSADSAQIDTISKVKSHIDPLLVDTPKVLKAGTDYITIATSPYDKLYFGDKFSPYKMEPYDIADIEEVIDSLIKSQKSKGNFKNKSLTDFKYQIFSVKTAKQKLQTRVQAICTEQADRKKWNSSRLEIEDGGDCYFSIIYDLTDKKIILFQVNGDA